MAKPQTNPLDQHIGKRLRKLRQGLNISAEKLADVADTTQQQISRYENGNNKISATQLYALAYSLNTPVAWFFQEYEPKEALPRIYEAPPNHESEKIKEELETINAQWHRLAANEREIVLKLMDTFLLEGKK